jgi:hypothetical protein
MGIQVEFNPDLALRNFTEAEEGNRNVEECIPKDLVAGETYSFLKKGQRLYWLCEDPEWNFGEIPLVETKGGQKLSDPLASIKILEVTHFLRDKEVWTRGKYRVIEVFQDKNIRFNWMKKI